MFFQIVEFVGHVIESPRCSFEVLVAALFHTTKCEETHVSYDTDILVFYWDVLSDHRVVRNDYFLFYLIYFIPFIYNLFFIFFYYKAQVADLPLWISFFCFFHGVTLRTLQDLLNFWWLLKILLCSHHGIFTQNWQPLRQRHFISPGSWYILIFFRNIVTCWRGFRHLTVIWPHHLLLLVSVVYFLYKLQLEFLSCIWIL